LNIQGADANPAYIANARDDSIGLPVVCSSSWTSAVYFESDVPSLITDLQVSKTVLVLVGQSPLQLENVFFNPTEDFTGAISGPLAPNLHAQNVTFSPRITRAGYYTVEPVVAGDEIIRNISMPYLVNGAIQVPTEASLGIEAGTRFKMRGGISVNGSLVIEGSLEQNVFFSGASDTRYEGSTDVGFSGDFTGIYFSPTSHSSTVKHAVLAQTGLNQSTALLVASGSSPVIENVFLNAEDRSMSSALIRVFDEGQPVFTCLRIRTTNTDTWAAFANANIVASVDAKEIYWDDPRGPSFTTMSPPGPRVDGDVDFTPFRTSSTDACSIDPPSSLLLDVDGDGQVNPVIDGVLVARYMGGLRGQDLIQDLVVPEGSNRRSAAEIETYLHWITTRSAR
jgi:hypothetical protein